LKSWGPCPEGGSFLFSGLNAEGARSMNDIGLSLHYVRVKRKNEKGYLPTHCFADTADLMAVILEALASLHDKPDDDKKRQTRIQTEAIHQKPREVFGKVSAGGYGLASRLVDIRTGQKSEPIPKEPFHADMMPFFYHFDLPEGEDKGILALETIRNFSITQPLTRSITREFRKRYPSFVLSFNPILDKDLIDQYVREDSKLTAIHYKKFGLPSDIADSMTPQRKPEEGSVEFTIKLLPKGFPLLSQVRGLLRGNAESKQALFELVRPVVNDEFDDVSVTTETDGQKRSLNIKDAINGLRMDFDITRDVTFEDGHPTLDSIYQISRTIISERWTKLKGKGE
jgi:hypothetical protein